MSRREIFNAATAIPVAIAATPAAAAILPTASEINRLCKAHHAAWQAYSAACQKAGELETFDDPEDIEVTVAGKPHFILMRSKPDALVMVRNVFREARLQAASDRAFRRETSLAPIRADIAALTVEESTAVDAVGRAFEEHRARVAASPAGIASQAATTAGNLEDEVWDALLAAPCETSNDVAVKAAYVMSCTRAQDIGLQAGEIRDIALSFARVLDA